MSKLILAIEDDKAIAELYEDLLTGAGYQVRVMRSKPANVQLIEQIRPDLVLSDWGLGPENLNWNFINNMQHTPGTATIPILVCTAMQLKTNNTGSQLKDRKISVVEKPFDIDELLGVVEETLGLSDL